ncbi:glycosyltransferase family 2 protein [Acinetobacter bereziniae]|uniref:glycosyltransferase family 2 protein n=1 Tax=Acinetobacter bereziniae TaxID=106648 RepID=UPI00295451E3|nr:glycosyltransferase family 2 protein [Acinetobacter bereziniae]MDV8157371.1 glycosyltransferase family 2 protein [Acinetobacter bereziniae]
MHNAFLLQPKEELYLIKPSYSPIFFSLIIPLYNEEETVVALIDTIQRALGTQQQPWELIVVDDGSCDATVNTIQQKLLQSPLNARLIQLSRNYGQTAAMQAGIDESQGQYIVTMDGDLQNDPHDIPAMLQQLIDQDLDLLVGWRKNRQDALLLRKIPSLLANRLIGRISGLRLHDYGCSLKIYRAEIIKQIRLVGEMHRFIPLWVASVVPVSRIGEVPVRHHARQFGQSKYGISRTIRVILDLMSVMFFQRYLMRPGHLFGSIGLLLGCIGSVMLTYLAIDKYILDHSIGTRPMLLIGVMCVLMSLQFLMTGIIAELITRTYLDSKNHKSYLIRRVYQHRRGQ